MFNRKKKQGNLEREWECREEEGEPRRESNLVSLSIRRIYGYNTRTLDMDVWQSGGRVNQTVMHYCHLKYV